MQELLEGLKYYDDDVKRDKKLKMVCVGGWVLLWPLRCDASSHPTYSLSEASANSRCPMAKSAS